MIGAMAKEKGQKLIAQNKRARHEYTILDTYECGMVLTGTEVKSLRNGKASLTDGYGVIRRGEVFLVNVHIGPYEKARRENAEPRRERKLLLHRAEISRLEGKVAERGLTLIPLRLYFKNGRAKVELGLAKGRKRHDKREAAKREEAKREARAAEGRKR